MAILSQVRLYAHKINALLKGVRRKYSRQLSYAVIFALALFLFNIGTEIRYSLDRQDLLERIKLRGQVFQSDPGLIRLIQTDLLEPPAPPNAPYNLSNSVIEHGQYGQAEAALSELNGLKGGFFVEAGAWDGEFLSNTLMLEATHGWTGVLVEPNVKAYGQLRSRNRKAYTVNACLALEQYPEQVVFDGADVYGVVTNNTEVVQSDALNRARDELPPGFREKFSVQCLPFYSILEAVGNPVVDFFSLDVEGSELAVLKTIPWDKVNIRVITIEVEHSNATAIRELMKKNNYRVAREIGSVDLMFVKND